MKYYRIAMLFFFCFALLTGCDKDKEQEPEEEPEEEIVDKTPTEITVSTYATFSVGLPDAPKMMNLGPQGDAYLSSFHSDAIYHVTTVPVRTFIKIPAGVPQAHACDMQGNLYVRNNYYSVYKITPGGDLSTAIDFMNKDGDGSMCIDADGNIYIGDQYVVTKYSAKGEVLKIFGNEGVAGYKDGSATEALFNQVYSLSADKKGNIYVADKNNNRIRRISVAGKVTTVAGSGTAGYADGDAASALFNKPRGICVDSLGAIYVADTDNHVIRRIGPGPTGRVTTFAGSIMGSVDGSGTEATFNIPLSIGIDAQQRIVVYDLKGLRRITYKYN